MSKEIIENAFNQAKDNYIWNLYFFRINRKRKNPYMTYKKRFKNDTYISDYAKNLLKYVRFYQLDAVYDVQD